LIDIQKHFLLHFLRGAAVFFVYKAKKEKCLPIFSTKKNSSSLFSERNAYIRFIMPLKKFRGLKHAELRGRGRRCRRRFGSRRGLVEKMAKKKGKQKKTKGKK